MSNILVLHGHDSRPHPDYPIYKELADNVITFNAPFSMPGAPDRYKWFTLPEENIPGADPFAEVEQSVKYILEKIGDSEIDVLFGRSQGGFMALYLTLNNLIRPKKTIAAVPFYLPNLIHENINKETPILWMAGGKDERIPPEVGNLYKNLIDAGANLDYLVDSDSGHSTDTWTQNFNDTIVNWNKGK